MTDVSGKPPSDDESGIRHPIRAAEHELEHLREVANEGESAKTPAIVAGGMLAFLIPLFALVLTLVLGIAYFATRGEGDGTPGPTGAGSQGPTATHAGEAAPPPPPPPSQTQGSATAGQSVFADNCSGCHGVAGHGGGGGPDLSAIPAAKNLQRVIDQVTNGGGGMPPFKGSLTDQQIKDAAAYVTAKVAK